MDDSEETHEYYNGNGNPEIASSYLSYGVELLQMYGWVVLAVLLAAYFLWQKFGHSLTGLVERGASAVGKKDDPQPQADHEAILKSRLRLQERYDADVNRFNEKQSEIERKKREMKIADWENQQAGKSTKNDIPPGAPAENEDPVRLIRSSARHRTDVNPLMGAAPSPRWRPEPRRSAQGG